MFALLILLTLTLAITKDMFTLKPGEIDEMRRRQNSEDPHGCEQSSDEEGDTGSNSGDGCGAGICNTLDRDDARESDREVGKSEYTI